MNDGLNALLQAFGWLPNPSTGAISPTTTPPSNATIKQGANQVLQNAQNNGGFVDNLVQGISGGVSSAVQQGISGLFGGVTPQVVLFYGLFAAVLLIGLLGLVLQDPDVETSIEKAGATA